MSRIRTSHGQDVPLRSTLLLLSKVAASALTTSLFLVAMAALLAFCYLLARSRGTVWHKVPLQMARGVVPAAGSVALFETGILQKALEPCSGPAGQIAAASLSIASVLAIAVLYQAQRTRMSDWLARLHGYRVPEF